MFRNITYGQYYPGNSILHKLDPRVKLAGVLVFVICLFIANNIWGLVFCAVCLAALIAASEIAPSHMLKGLRAIWILLLMIVLFNALFTDGRVLWKWGIIIISREGIRNAVFYGIRMVFVILGTSLLMYTTTPTTLTSGMEKAFSVIPRFPARDFAMMMSISLRFIPILAEEADITIKAQKARGASFDTGGIIARTKSMTPVLIPLFVSAFRRASDLADAMEARCYGASAHPTKLNPLKYAARDKIAYIILLFAFIDSLAIRIFL